MGLNVAKRVSSLRKQVDQSQSGRWSVARVTILVFLAFVLLSLFLVAKKPYPEKTPDKDLTTVETHSKRVDQLVWFYETRSTWLADSWFSIVPGAHSSYTSLAESVITSFASTEPTTNTEPSVFEFDNLSRWFSYYSANAVLRVGFGVLAFWPLWLLSLTVGYVLTMRRNRTSSRDTILSILTRGKGPFYSGIYGPLRPNNSLSATELSCPSLACPAMVTRSQATNHPLFRTLKKYGAVNETNIDLLRTVLAHADFPPFVGEEIPVQLEEQEQTLGALEERKSNTGYFEIENNFTLERKTVEGLVAVLEAHDRIRRYRAMLEKRSFTASSLNKNYSGHTTNVAKLLKGAPALSKILLQVLSPDRLWALGGVSSNVVATAYLSIEAGKSLVYKRHGEGYTRISNYPHLQARAVVQSVAAYHREYDGDTRLIIRQAIICSRRHGDFGRAFLPNRMPIQSRGIRDWLEILYAIEEERETIADLVELDAHIEELSVNWRKGFISLVQGETKTKGSERLQKVNQGVPLKSVVLFPLHAVISASLKGVHPERLERVTELLPKTQKYQTHLSISARLPGFKRQAMEAERSGEDSDGIIHEVQKQKEGEKILAQWRIVRRMLTRYNWLSTRIGDDAVPVTGLVLACISDGDTEVLPPLVPLRQRRFTELFGKGWESKLYAEQIDADLIEIYTTHSAFEEAVQQKKSDKPEKENEEETPEKQTVGAT